MHNYKTTKRALKLYHSYNPHYFPLRFLQIVFENLAPYFNLWMSAELVTALYQGQAKSDLCFLAGITLLGNLLIRIIGAFFGRAVDTALKQLEDNEAAAFNRKTLSLDYDKIENPEIRLLRRRIRENSCTNRYGVQFMRLKLEAMMSSVMNIFFSLILFAEMLSVILTVSFDIRGILLLGAIFLLTGIFVAAQARCNTQQSVCLKDAGEWLLRENQFGRGYYCLSGMDSRIYRQEHIVSQFQKRLAGEHLRVFRRFYHRSFVLSLPAFFCVKASELCAYLIICLYCTLGAFPVGSVIKYAGYLGSLIRSIGNFFSELNELKSNEPFLETYMEYFDIKNDMYQGSLSVEKRSDKKFDIEFQNVSFRYAGTENFAIKNINLKLMVGERLAVVGQNGSGKTTFIKLLCRLYDPTEGEIRMNDFNIRKYDYRQYLDLFSVVFQDYNLLSMPLGNNVASAAVWDSVKAEQKLCEVGFGERYKAMPKKLETPLYKDFDEDGVNISGGEAQKIALARALYRDAPFIILDEPTAALDPIAEAEIYAGFDGLAGDRTAVYISHRLSSCRFCDRIVVFDAGEIVQTGTHEELLADENGKYYELWKAQAQYYV